MIIQDHLPNPSTLSSPEENEDTGLFFLNSLYTSHLFDTMGRMRRSECVSWYRMFGRCLVEDVHIVYLLICMLPCMLWWWYFTAAAGDG